MSGDACEELSFLGAVYASLHLHKAKGSAFFDLIHFVLNLVGSEAMHEFDSLADLFGILFWG